MNEPQSTLAERDAADRRRRHDAVQLAKVKALIASNDPAELDAIVEDDVGVITSVIERADRVPGPALADSPRILDVFADEIATAGLAGERRLAKLIYLVVTSRLLDRIVSIAVKGPSSAGKSFIVERVLAFFPPEAYYALSAMSEHALVYDREPLKHRMMVFYEAAGLTSDLATYMLRSLLSEGRVRYVTVEKAKGGALQPRLIDREGPTGLIVTTTEVKLHPENETRLLSLTVTDSQEQTRAVLLALTGEAIETDTQAWHELQSWLAEQDNRAVVPYDAVLAKAIPPVALRLRRDFAAVLALVRAHAVLHQAQRDRDSKGRILASLEDYAAVRELVADLVAEAAEQTVPITVRETVSAVASSVAGGVAGGETTLTKVAEQLKLDKSAASRRVASGLQRPVATCATSRTSEDAPHVSCSATRFPKSRLCCPRWKCCSVAVSLRGIHTKSQKQEGCT